jgi:hypothetical protein
MTWYPGFWFDLLLKVKEVNVQNVTISLQVSLLFDLEYSNIVLPVIGTVYISTKFQPDQTSSIAARLSPFCIYLHINNTTWTNNI